MFPDAMCPVPQFLEIVFRVLREWSGRVLENITTINAEMSKMPGFEVMQAHARRPYKAMTSNIPNAPWNRHGGCDARPANGGGQDEVLIDQTRAAGRAVKRNCQAEVPLSCV